MSEETSSGVLGTPDTKRTDSDSGLESQPSLEAVAEQSVPAVELPTTEADTQPPVVPQDAVSLPEGTESIPQMMESAAAVTESSTVGMQL